MPHRTLGAMNDILALVDDATLLDGLRRVAAAADRTLDESVPPVTRRPWLDAAAIVVDSDTARACATALPRRPGIVLVCAGPAGLTDWQAAAAIGAEHVLGLPDDEVELLAVLGAAAEPSRGSGTVLTVVGGAGGAGASTLAAALAWAAALDRTATALLVDADPFGAGLDILAGLEDRPGVRWPGLTVDGGRISARALLDAVPRWTPRLGVLAGEAGANPPGAHALAAVVDAARGAGATVICDVGRTFGELADTAVGAADLTILVTQARVGAALSAVRAAAWLAERTTEAGVVVRGPAPGGLRAVDVADVTGLPLLAAMRPQPGLAESLDRGGLRLRRRSPLLAAATAVLDTVAPAAGRRVA